MNGPANLGACGGAGVQGGRRQGAKQGKEGGRRAGQGERTGAIIRKHVKRGHTVITAFLTERWLVLEVQTAKANY